MRFPRSTERRTPPGAPFFVSPLPVAAALLALALVVVPGSAAAHDFWIEPSDLRPTVGERLSLHLRVGHGGEADSVPRTPTRQVRFVARSPSGEIRDVAGVDGAAPAGYLVPDRAGVWTVGYRTNDAFSELAGDRFDAYLEEEGLDWAVERRRQAGLADEPGRELYSRSVKSLLQVGDGGDRSTLSEPLGLDLEIVPVDDPLVAATDAGKTRFRVLWNGEPAAGIQVDAHRLGDTEHVESEVSDDGGQVAFRLGDPGAWILAAVAIEEVDPRGNDQGAHWRSVWTSLTFERLDR